MRLVVLVLWAAFLCSGCAVVAVGGSALTVVATTVQIGAVVVGTPVDVGAAGLREITGSSND